MTVLPGDRRDKGVNQGIPVHIGIGSNLGEKVENCLRAMEMLRRIPECRIVEHSSLYRTTPVGVAGQGFYVNGAVAMGCGITARELLKEVLAIERHMGRVREGRWGPRTIDLDILIFGQEVIHESDLVVPHPFMHLRRFVLVPLVELAPDLIHPTLGLSMIELLDKIPEDGQLVSPIRER